MGKIYLSDNQIFNTNIYSDIIRSMKCLKKSSRFKTKKQKVTRNFSTSQQGLKLESEIPNEPNLR